LVLDGCVMVLQDLQKYLEEPSLFMDGPFSDPDDD